MPYTLNVNGKATTVDVPADMPLLWALRDVLNLKGTKFGCGIGQCGACTVNLRGRATRSCQVTVAQAANAAITTIEGLSADGTHPLQRAWQEIDVPQCGYCQAGQIMTAAALLSTNPEAERRGDQHRDDRQPVPLRHLPAHQAGGAPRGGNRGRPADADGRRRCRVGGAAMLNPT